MATEFTTPTGRLVWGDVFTPQKLTEDDNKTPKLDKTTGQQMVEYSVGVAFRKNDPEWPAFYALLKQADREAWPQYHDPVTNQVRPGVKFADKITDGDGFDRNGNPYSQRDGYAGCWIVKFASRFPPTAHRHDGRQWVQITDPSAIKRGYFVRVSGSTQTNNSTQSPGMYRNLSMVAFVAYGPEIVSQGGNPNAAFGGAPVALPPGASATPLAPPPGAPTVPAPATPPPPAVPAAPAAPPYTGYMQTPAVPAPAPVAPPAPPPPAVPAAPAAPQYAVTRGDATYNAYIAAGWKDEQLIQQGLMSDYVPH